ncbi:MAG: hypothetical protein R3E97_18380 [Candidatus Eisenbacteria bacterium]
MASLFLASAFLIPLLIPSASAHAGLTEFEWSPPSALDTGAETVGDSGGRIAEFDFQDDGLWRLVYVKDGDIYLAEGNGSGWMAPVRITDDPAASRSPSIFSIGNRLHVVWEDERSGHSEVWATDYDGSTWNDAVCLSCDDAPSRKPAADGGPDEGDGLVVWEDEASPGVYSIHASAYSGGGWGTPMPVSESTGNATDPTISQDQNFGIFGAVWVDDRHGATELYGRAFNGGFGWRSEIRITDLPGNCAHPRMAGSYCCYDNIDLVPLVVFEYDGGAAVETWATYTFDWHDWQVFAVSEDDGTPSTDPRVAGVKYRPDTCEAADSNISFVSWTDELSGGDVRQLGRYEFEAGTLDDPMTAGNIVANGLAARTRSPNAPVLEAWLTDTGVLEAREGLEFNCLVHELRTNVDYLYVSPDGGANEVHLIETCRNEDVSGAPLRMWFFGGLETRFAIDPFQAMPFFDTTDANGIAPFVFRGGGCVTQESAGDGVVVITCPWILGGPAAVGYSQVKSPDIDGTCTVDAWDVEYVEDRIGSDDFCADLDGSGLVDAADVAIVQASLGAECARTADGPGENGQDPPITDPDQPFAVGTVFADGNVLAVPNPGRSRFEVTFALRAGDAASVQIVDVTGRTVRDLGVVQASRDQITPVVWNRQDGSGRAVAAGVYYAAVRRDSEARPRRATLIVVD